MNVLLMGLHATANADRLAARLRGPAEIATHLPEDGRDALAAALREAEVLVAMHVGADLPPAPRLRLLQLPGAGYDGIDFAALPPGLPVCNVYEHEIGIAEYVMAALLERTIGIGRMHATFREGRWEHSLLSFGATHGELAGSTVGIVGYGHIGRAVAARARAFGMRIVALGRTAPADEAGVEGRPVSALDSVLPEIDHLVLACPLTEDTRGLMDRDRFRRMKPTAVLVNVARAAVCVEDDLWEALSERRIGGAVLDVWYRYPPAGEEALFRPASRPFHTLDNVLMTPHASAWTDGLLDRRWTVIADNIDRLATARPLLNRVTPR